MRARILSISLALLSSAIAFVALADPTSAPSAPPPTSSAAAASPEMIAAGKRAFVDVARVLQSPRCVNCHPVGDAPMNGDHGKVHAMNITRTSVDAGLACATCHQDRNSEALGIRKGPPGAPKWGLPPPEMPLVFQNKSLTELCLQLKNPDTNGHKDFDALFAHVDHDPLVLWGWNPGGKRTLPPLSHEAFVAAFRTWLASGAACP